MAHFGSNHVTLTLASAAARQRSNSAFIRELWTDEIQANYKANLVLPQLVRVANHRGRKGDTFHIPQPVRGEASQKVAETAVTLIANQEQQKQVIIDQHWEYSRLIEDIVSVQAEDILRQFYTDDAGFALAKRVDRELHDQGAKFNGAGEDNADPTVESSAYGGALTGDGTAWDSTAATGAGNAASIDDNGIRIAIQHLDENDVPSPNRWLVIPPVEKRKMLGIDRQVVFDKVGEPGRDSGIRNGFVGPLYGVDVFMTTHGSTTDSDDATTHEVALLFQQEALILVEQLAVRSQTQYQQAWLSDLFTSDMIFGRDVLRPEAGIAIVVPAS